MTVVVKVMFLILFIYWINCVTCYTCTTWITVDGCNSYETSFWAQTFTDNTPSISVLSSFKEITVEGQYGQVTSIIPHCITSNEGIAISRSLIEAYFARKYTDIYEYRVGNSIAENELTSFVDIPSSLTFELPCNVNQNYFTTGVSMNHAIILQYTNGGNGRICLDAGDTLSDAGVIGGDINGSCTTYDYDSNSDMQFTFDTFALLGETYTPTSVTIPTPQPTTIQPSLAAQSLSCSGSCSCSGNRDCIISCQGEERCESSTFQCNAGYACSVYCSGEETCDKVKVEANGATSLVFACGSGDSETCQSATVNCASTVYGCTLDCSSSSSSGCRYITVTCGTGDCSIDCSGSSSKCSSLNVDASVASSYDCSGSQCSSSVTVVTGNPTKSPSLNPTSSPTTFAPVKPPTIFLPSVQPTYNPSGIPSSIPTGIPSSNPTTDSPTTSQPTKNPTTSQPTFVPSALPTRFPTYVPSESPTTVIPTATPTTSAPSYVPSVLPSISPTSAIPSLSPSVATSFVPSIVPSSTPSSYPTIIPTYFPTNIPTYFPTNNPNVESVESVENMDNDQPFMTSNEYSLFSEENVKWFVIAASAAICSFIILAVVYLRKRRRKLYAQAMNIQTMLRLRSTEDLQKSHVFCTPLSSMSNVSNTGKAFNNGLNTNSLQFGSYSNSIKKNMTNETNIYLGSSASAFTPTIDANTLSVGENFNSNVLSTAVVSNDMLMNDVLSSMQTAGGDNIIENNESSDDYDEEFEVVSDIENKTAKEGIFIQKFKLKSVGKYDRNGNIILDNNHADVLSTAVVSNDMLMDDVLSSMQTAGGDNIIDESSTDDDDGEFEVVSDIEIKTAKEDIFKQKFKLNSVGKYDRNGNIILLDNIPSNNGSISNVNNKKFHPQMQKNFLKKNETVIGLLIGNEINENGALDMDIDNIFIDVDGGMFVSDAGIDIQSDINAVISNTTTDDFVTKESVGNNEHITAGGLDDENVSESESSDSSTDEGQNLDSDEFISNGAIIGSDPQTKSEETQDVNVESDVSDDVSDDVFDEGSDVELELDDSSDDNVLQEMDTIC